MPYTEAFSISTEQQKLETDTETLEQTEGFEALTKRQQRIIEQSLYIQQRAERGTDVASAWAIVSPERGYVTNKTQIHTQETLERMHKFGSPDPSTRKYVESQNTIANGYCHSSILNLELEKGWDTAPLKIPEGFFKAEYFTVSTYKELKNAVIEEKMPVVLHINDYADSFNEGMGTIHSCLILGKDKEGNLLVWEKEGDGLPYKISRLESVYEAYKTREYWGLRKLRSKEDY